MLLTLIAAASVALAAETTEEPPVVTVAEWLTSQLKEKDTPDWVNQYIVALDSSISDSSARTYFRRFIADSNTKLDATQKFVEYLSLAGYPEALILDRNGKVNVEPSDIYKAVYFATTYTIMDAIPSTPS